MNKAELLDYISSFDKNPGDYTDDELYLIGVAHKTLDKSEKNWAELASMVGINKSGENYRKWVCSRQLKDGTLPKNVRELNGRTIQDLTPDQTNNKLDEKLADLYVQQTKTRATYDAYRRTLRDEARIQSFKDNIVEAASKVGELKPLNYTKYFIHTSKNDDEAILMLSDFHIGADIDNFYNKYNVSIARKRLEKLSLKVVDYLENNNISRLNVVGLGDFIHGHIHVNARLEQELSTVEQIMTASELLAETLSFIAGRIPNVTYRSCTDNHSRAVANKDEHIEKDNFGKIVDWYLAERLKNTNIKFMNDNIDDGIGKFDLLNGKKVMFAHGHQDNVNKIADNFIMATREYIDYILLAHYHSSREKSYSGMKVFVNGSLMGVDSYALSKRLFGNAEQTLLIFKDDNVMNISIDLQEAN